MTNEEILIIIIIVCAFISHHKVITLEAVNDACSGITVGFVTLGPLRCA